MLEGINALLSAAGDMWSAFVQAPLYGSLTWGYFLIAVAIMEIFIVFFIGRLK